MEEVANLVLSSPFLFVLFFHLNQWQKDLVEKKIVLISDWSLQKISAFDHEDVK